MATLDPVAPARPLFSLIIAVYNDWVLLERCLSSLDRQTSEPSFEVIVVDDGSHHTIPASILARSSSFSLTAIRQAHAGIPTARNLGVKASKGSILVFVDADCNLQAGCLAMLASSIARHPGYNCFQLRLTGNCSTLVGRAEELRLLALQGQFIQPDGRICYLNTAGFAIRRTKVDTERGLFDTSALRGEDTLLLATLIEQGELPFFVADAVVQHAVSLTVGECFRKDIRATCLEGRAYEIIAAKGLKIRVTPRQRLRMLSFMWKLSGKRSIGRSAWFLTTARQGLQRTISSVCRRLPSRSYLQ